MNSLRWRLITGILSGLALLFGGVGLFAYYRIKESFYEEFDKALSQRASSLTTMMEEEKKGIEIEWEDEGIEPPGHIEGRDYFSLWDATTGELIRCSAALQKHNVLPRFGGPLSMPEVRTVKLPDGKTGRAAGIEFPIRLDLKKAERALITDPADLFGKPLQVVAAKVDTVEPVVRQIRWTLLVFWAVCTLAAGLLTWLVVQTGLRPLHSLKNQIGRLEDTGGNRITLASQPKELEPVTRELNRLLERVEEALKRERQLTSNVAHELRTPVAGLLSTLEVALSRQRSREEYVEAFQDCFDVAKRMHWLVGNLLSLSRIESGNVNLQPSVIDLRSALAEWWTPFADVASNNSVRVKWEIEKGSRVQTDAGYLRIVCSNLFDNAVSYASRDSTIVVSATRAGEIGVLNPAPGLESEHMKSVFDPFWRNCSVRDSGVHAGLGLSLSKKIMQLLGGSIKASVANNGKDFKVHLRFSRVSSRSSEVADADKADAG